MLKKQENGMKCSICNGRIEPLIDPTTGKVAWDQGHNAEPVAEGRCCDQCNSTIVLATRLQKAGINPLPWMTEGVLS